MTAASPAEDCWTLENHAQLRDWRQRLASNIEVSMGGDPLWLNAKEHLLTILSGGDSTIRIWRGEGTLLVIIWPSGEIKTLVEREGNIVGENPFWLEKWPFVTWNKDSNSFQGIRNSSEIEIVETKINDINKLLLPTHNGHFGHFIGDDLPWLAAAALLLNTQNICVPEYTTNNFIERELNCLRIKASSAVMQISMGKISRFNCKNLIHGFINDWALRSFLVKKYVRHSYFNDSQLLTQPRGARRVFVHRVRQQTRILNFDDVLNCLLARSFKSTSLGQKSLAETFQELKEADVIVCEGGTTTLVTSICCSQHTRILSLQPLNILTNPDEPMMQSGLPYIMFYHDHIALFAGDPEETYRNQISSSSTAFDCVKLGETVDKLTS